MGAKVKGGCEGRWARRRDRDVRVRGVEAEPAVLALYPPGGPQTLGSGVRVCMCVCMKWGQLCSHSSDWVDDPVHRLAWCSA